MRKRTVIVGIGTTALAAWGVARAKRLLGGHTPDETGRFPSGMEYARWGDGPKKVLWIPGGPGGDVPRGTFGAFQGRQFRALVGAGFSVWYVTRRRNMPVGHSVADMADDYAALIRDHLGGRVDVVVGVSYGGLIAQYIAAEHPATAERVVLALAAATITPWARDVDRRMAVARAEGRMDDAALAMSEYLFPNPGQSRQRRLVAPLMRGTFSDEQVPSGDLLVEADAEVAFDARAVLPQIELPVLVVSAQEDLFFPREVVQETVDLIPDCTWIEYEGIGHIRAVGSGRLAEDIAAFAQ